MPTRDPMPEDDLDPDLDEQDSAGPSRNRLRDQAREYLELADELAKGKHATLPDPPFDETLREAIADAQRFLKNARSRQLRRVAQLLRGAGTMDELRAAVEGRTPTARAKQALERRCEDWRTRLIEQGDPALAEFIAGHPDADRQRLRQLARQASRTPPDARSKRAGTTLIRMIRVQLEALEAAEAAALAAELEATDTATDASDD
jgi:ribosome-associated protein